MSVGEPQTTMSRRRLSICLLGAAVLVSGCGSVTTPTRSSAATATVTRTVTAAGSPTSSSATASTVTHAAAATSTTSTPGSASATAPMCLTSDFTLVSLGASAATGHGLLAFGLRNHSGHACTTGGYPGILLLDAAGRGLPTVPQRTTEDFFGTTPLRELTVAAGDLVSFRLSVVDVSANGSGSGCESVHGLQVIVPNNTAGVDISRTFSVCGGTVSVSPLQAGSAARP